MAQSPLECIHGEGARQLVYFVGYEESKQIWVEEKIKTWVAGVNRLA